MKVEAWKTVAPFVIWMVLMAVLPAAPWAYAVRTAATAVALAWVWAHGVRPAGSLKLHFAPILWGVLVGLVVLALWVWPEQFAFYRKWLMYGYTANAPVDASAGYWKAIRLFGSAFVISVAEELFFRRWLLRYAGFLWMVALFALEHNRWAAGAVAGALYGWLALRQGLGSAIVAHVVTNLGLGIFVLATDAWQFW